MAEENIQDTDAPGDIEEIEALEQPAGEENDSLEADDTGASADEDAGPYDDGLLDDEDGDNELEPVEQLGRDETRAVLHALLFVSDKPTSVDRFSEALGGVDYDVVRNLLAELRELPMAIREAERVFIGCRADVVEIELYEQLMPAMNLFARASAARRQNDYRHDETRFEIEIPRELIEPAEVALAAELRTA